MVGVLPPRRQNTPPGESATESRSTGLPKQPRGGPQYGPGFRPSELRAARRLETTDEQGETYAQRAGIEGTLARGMHRCRLRRTRFRGQPKVHLRHILTATGLNFTRLGEWIGGTARRQSRRSPLARLLTPPLAI